MRNLIILIAFVFNAIFALSQPIFIPLNIPNSVAWSTINKGTYSGGVILSGGNLIAQVTTENGVLGSAVILSKKYWEITLTTYGSGSYTMFGIGKFASAPVTNLGSPGSAGGAYPNGHGVGFLYNGNTYAISNTSFMAITGYPIPTTGLVIGCSFDPILGVFTCWTIATGASYPTFPYSGSGQSMTSGDWYPWVATDGSPNTYTINVSGPFLISGGIPSGCTAYGQ